MTKTERRIDERIMREARRTLAQFAPKPVRITRFNLDGTLAAEVTHTPNGKPYKMPKAFMINTRHVIAKKKTLHEVVAERGMLTIPQAANRLDVARNVIDYAIKSGKLKATRLPDFENKPWMLAPRDVDAFTPPRRRRSPRES